MKMLPLKIPWNILPSCVINESNQNFSPQMGKDYFYISFTFDRSGDKPRKMKRRLRLNETKMTSCLLRKTSSIASKKTLKLRHWKFPLLPKHAYKSNEETFFHS
jgi:hypothetical protein